MLVLGSAVSNFGWIKTLKKKPLVWNASFFSWKRSTWTSKSLSPQQKPFKSGPDYIFSWNFFQPAKKSKKQKKFTIQGGAIWRTYFFGGREKHQATEKVVKAEEALMKCSEASAWAVTKTLLSLGKNTQLYEVYGPCDSKGWIWHVRGQLGYTRIC